METLIGDGVHRLGDDVVNFYVIVEGTELTLVDAGLPGHRGRLMELLASLGRSIEDVRAVLLTHTHLDHVGLAEHVRKHAGAVVWAHECDADALMRPSRPAANAKPERGLGRYLLRRPGALAVPLRLARQGAFRTPAVMAASRFTGGHALDVPGRPQVVEVPGHTPGSVAFHLPERGVVLTGDALVTHDGIVGRTGPRIVSAAFTHDSARALRSLDALADLDADLVLPGHGTPFTGGIDAAVRSARQEGVG